MKMRKMYNQSIRLCAFRNWATGQKQLKSTQLDRSVTIEQNTTEEKTKDVIIHNPILCVNFKIRNVSLAYMLHK